MNIFVFSTHALWQPHLETELEIIQNHLNNGDTVYRFVCNGDLPACDVNNNHTLNVCIQCRQMSICGSSLLEGEITDLPIIHKSAEIKEKTSHVNLSYDTIEDIKNIYTDNFDVGTAALSSIISWLREPELDINKNRKLIDYCLKSALWVYFSAVKYMEEYNPDIVYAFNGRLVHVKPILRAAARCRIDCYIHERGNDKDHYSLYKNTTPHDRTYVASKMYDLWNNADPEKRIVIGESFYTERVAGKDQGWYSFTKTQEKGLLPDDWNKNKRNIAIFNSSEDEFASIGPDWKNDLYTTQLEAIRRIIEDAQKFNDIHFYLRVHPNLSNLANSEINGISQLNSPNLTIINPDSPISSYDLLFNCEKVLAFGSSVGIEAVYWGKPSIQAGKSYYYDFDATYKPASHEELIEMINADLEPLLKTPALVYGHYFKTFGIPFKYYYAQNLATGKFKGVNINERAKTTDTVYKWLRRKFVFKLPLYLIELDYKKNKRKLESIYLKKRKQKLLS